jgi:uncharacterized membrane protein
MVFLWFVPFLVSYLLAHATILTQIVGCHWAVYLGSGGLALLMFLGFIVRIKIRDGFLRSSPAFIYMIINLIIFFLAENRV